MNFHEHRPASQVRDKRNGHWRGRCSCGAKFSGDNLGDFNDAWHRHQEEVRLKVGFPE